MYARADHEADQHAEGNTDAGVVSGRRSDGCAEAHAKTHALHTIAAVLALARLFPDRTAMIATARPTATQGAAARIKSKTLFILIPPIPISAKRSADHKSCDLHCVCASDSIISFMFNRGSSLAAGHSPVMARKTASRSKLPAAKPGISLMALQMLTLKLVKICAIC